MKTAGPGRVSDEPLVVPDIQLRYFYLGTPPLHCKSARGKFNLCQQGHSIASSLIISGKALGKRSKPLFEDFSVPFPPDMEGDGGLTLRELITRIVRFEVEAFGDRQEKRRLSAALSPAQIERGLEKGKVDMGGNDLKQAVCAESAIGAALEAFEDGLYLVVIDGREHRELDAQIYLRPDSRITFIRLTFLAGA